MFWIPDFRSISLVFMSFQASVFISFVDLNLKVTVNVINCNYVMARNEMSGIFLDEFGHNNSLKLTRKHCTSFTLNDKPYV